MLEEKLKELRLVQLNEKGETVEHVLSAASGSTEPVTFAKDYTEAEMTNKVATVEHNLNSENVSVTVYDQDGKQVIAEDIVIVDANSLTVNVSTLTLTGIKVVVLASGGTSSAPVVENAVLYTPQTLTTEQQAQARANIGADTFASETVAGIAKMWVDAEGTLHISTEE